VEQGVFEHQKNVAKTEIFHHKENEMMDQHQNKNVGKPLKEWGFAKF